MTPPVKRPVANSALASMSIPEPMSRGCQRHFEVDQSIMIVFYGLPFRFSRSRGKYNSMSPNWIKLRAFSSPSREILFETAWQRAGEQERLWVETGDRRGKVNAGGRNRLTAPSRLRERRAIS